MKSQVFEYLEKGIYSISEAGRLSDIHPNRIRRWVKESPKAPPILIADFTPINSQVALSFLDLIELQFINEFRKLGVSWKEIKYAHLLAKELVKNDHPFSTQRFKTDGKKILAHLISKYGGTTLVEVVSTKIMIEKIMLPYLIEALDYNENIAERWWPMGKNHHIVIDPKRSFGKPIVYERGVPTSVLANSVKVEGSTSFVSRIYEVDEKSVIDAVEYENRLAA